MLVIYIKIFYFTSFLCHKTKEIISYFFSNSFELKNLFCLFVYFWLHRILIAGHRLSLVTASTGCSSCGARVSHCNDLCSCRVQALGAWASVAVAHRLTRSPACGIFLDQGSNPCPLHWQACSYPLGPQRSPT